ncbi:hypothetical protein FOZ62_010936 [Perkinsus olseni]|uniref:Uncharacterized protein n=1 Tax=Perkinsus olseni TaxID=32597 RepID=A0A7J6SFX2_PEROL|nr:hypothetical protein FOZ62_010936 [Perkinsus olseni]
MEYRIAQIDNAEIEMARMANLLLSLARHFHDGDITDAAEQMVVHTSEEKLRAHRKGSGSMADGPSLSDIATALGGGTDILAAPLRKS